MVLLKSSVSYLIKNYINNSGCAADIKIISARCLYTQKAIFELNIGSQVYFCHCIQ